MEITREYFEREGCYNYYIKEGNQIFKITFGGNLDLYFSLYQFKLSQEEAQKNMYHGVRNTFEITKENYFIYSLFEELYNDIKESRIFIPMMHEYKEDDEENFDYWEYLSEEEMNKRNIRYINTTSYRKLFHDNQIEWHSDDDEYEKSDRVIIRKEEDKFVLEFIRPEINLRDNIYRTARSVSIRFRNSGSQYDPYNMIFMRMFNKLQEYDPDYHQIHIEEIEHHKKLTLKK